MLIYPLTKSPGFKTIEFAIKLSLEEAAVLYGTTDYQDLEKKTNLIEKQILLVTLANKVGAITTTRYGAVDAVPDIHKLM